MTNTLGRGLPAAFFLLLTLPTPEAVAGSRPRLLLESPADESEPRVALLVLEAVRGAGISLLDARVAPGRPKLGRAASRGRDATVFSVTDADGTALLVGELDVPWTLHGPFMDEDGSIRCKGHEQDRVQFVLKLPLMADARELRFHVPDEFAPTDPDALASAIAADAPTAGLAPFGRIPLGHLARGAR